MNNRNIQKIFIATSMLLVSGIALAHDQSGSLGKAASATDYYQVSCFNDGNGTTHHLSLQILDMEPIAAPSVSVQVTKGNLAANTTDAKDGDAIYSPEVMLKGADGSYFVTVDKNKAGIENYSFQYHCETAANEHTGTNITPLQNQ